MVRAALQNDIRINAGGGQFVDSAGQVWSADQFFGGGFTYSTNRPISGTTSQQLFQTERSGIFSYRIPVASGRFRVTLYFSEIYFKSYGKRIFSVNAEGSTVLPLLDIFQLAGADAAFERTFEIETIDGTLDLDFIPVFENPKLSAIRIVHLREGPPPVLRVAAPADFTAPTAPVDLTLSGEITGQAPGDTSFQSIWEQTEGPAPSDIRYPTTAVTSVKVLTPGVYRFRLSASCYSSSASAFTRVIVPGDTSAQPPIRIRCGGPAYTDSVGKSWIADSFFQGGATFSSSGSIQSTQDPNIYLNERFGTFGYEIPVRNGLYSVRVHLAEIFFKTVGARVFNISAEGSSFGPAVDIVQKSGFRTAYVASNLVSVKDSSLSLKFIPVNENPKVSAIELIPITLDPVPLQLNAGPDIVLRFPSDAALLEARISTPVSNESTASYRWTQTAGAQSAVLETPGSSACTARFPAPGSYRFRVQVSLGSQIASAEVGVLLLEEVLPPFGVQTTLSQPPGVVPSSAQLSAVITGVPSKQAATWPGSWVQTEGPSGATLTNPEAPVCGVSFDTPGVYTFRYSSAYNGVSASSQVMVIARGDTSGQYPVRIRSGGGDYTDALGNSWAADSFFKGGQSFSVTTPVKGTADSALYQSERFGAFSYRIPLRNGLYSLRLHFAELWFKNQGDRVFTVNAEGKGILPSLDLVKNAGPLSAWIWSGSVRVADGSLDVDFLPVKENPKLAALEAVPIALDPPPLGVDVGSDLSLSLPADTLLITAKPTGASSQTDGVSCVWTQVIGPDAAHILNPTSLSSQVHFHKSGNYKFRATLSSGTASAVAELSIRVLPVPDPPGVIRIRCGGAGYVDSSNRVWSADAYFSPSSTYTTSGSIAATADPELYLTERTGTAFSYKIPAANGEYTVRLHFAEIYWNQPQKRLFNVSVGGIQVFKSLDLCGAAGPRAALVKEYVTNVTDGILKLEFSAQIDKAKISAIEVIPVLDPTHLLHVVIRAPEWVVDYSNTGVVPLVLTGSQSHTHGFGQNISRFEWREGDQILSNQPDLKINAPLGSHTYTLTIWDNENPPSVLQDQVVVEVLPSSSVRGVIASYFNASPSASSINYPAFVEVLPRFKIESTAGSLGGSGMSAASIVLRGLWTVQKSDLYAPVVPPGVSGSVQIDGTPWTGPLSLGVGLHEVVWAISLNSSPSAPVELIWKRSDNVTGTLLPVAHDESVMRPHINRMTAKGPALGGEIVEINGVGFFPSSSTSVLWGGRRLWKEILEANPTRLLLIAPAGSGKISVQVETPQGASNPMPYLYEAGTAPISFQSRNVHTLPGPTQAAWGPDGRLYVSSLTGAVTVLTFDDQYNVIQSQIIPGVQNTAAYNAIGIGFSPWESANGFKVYLAHARLFVTDGRANVRPSPYLGQVSALASPLFQARPLVSGLPSTNHDHGVNGIVFDNTGQLYVCVGGQTNAGIPNYNLGSLDESPLSAAVLVSTLGRPMFDGSISYIDAKTKLPSTDQNDSSSANRVGAPDVRVHSTGLRNAFGIVFASNGRLYATDNGPNTGFGAASVSATAQAGDPVTSDKVVLLGKNHYYGHPNRNRGRFDPRENRYQSPQETALPESSTPAIALLPSSRDGIDEYRATAFGGALRGALLVQEWNGSLSALTLSSDGRRVESILSQVWGTQRGLGVVCGPGGAILVVDYTGSQVIASLPDDKSVTGMVAYDIFPWRAPASGEFAFVIGGKMFGNVSNTTVSIGKQQARITSVTPQRIRGIIPASQTPTAAMLPVLVGSGGKTSIIPDAFRYLLRPGEGNGIWKEEPAIPLAPGATAAAEAGGLVYVLSEDASTFQAFNPVTGLWTSNFPPPPVAVSNHSLVSAGRELVLVGTADGLTPWSLQIYTPETRTWRQGAPGPWNSLRPGVAAIGRSVFVCGGQIAGAGSPVAAVYNADTNQWSPISQMPFPCLEPAAVSSPRGIWVLGGPSGAQNIGVQYYEPTAGAWSTGITSNSKFPSNRFGARAVFFADEIYLIGGRLESGETLRSIEVFLPQSLSWRSEVELPEPAWGVGAAANESEIFVVGGKSSTGALRSARVLVR